MLWKRRACLSFGTLVGAALVALVAYYGYIRATTT